MREPIKNLIVIAALEELDRFPGIPADLRAAIATRMGVRVGAIPVIAALDHAVAGILTRSGADVIDVGGTDEPRDGERPVLVVIPKLEASS